MLKPGPLVRYLSVRGRVVATRMLYSMNARANRQPSLWLGRLYHEHVISTVTYLTEHTSPGMKELTADPGGHDRSWIIRVFEGLITAPIGEPTKFEKGGDLKGPIFHFFSRS